MVNIGWNTAFFTKIHQKQNRVNPTIGYKNAGGMWLNRNVRIILDFRFAIFDWGRDPRDLTQGRKGVKPQRDFCLSGFGCQLVAERQTVPDAFRLCALAASLLCVEIHGIVNLARLGWSR
jgi:hypothetical protein